MTVTISSHCEDICGAEMSHCIRCFSVPEQLIPLAPKKAAFDDLTGLRQK